MHAHIHTCARTHKCAHACAHTAHTHVRIGAGCCFGGRQMLDPMSHGVISSSSSRSTPSRKCERAHVHVRTCLRTQAQCCESNGMEPPSLLVVCTEAISHTQRMCPHGMGSQMVLELKFGVVEILSTAIPDESPLLDCPDDLVCHATRTARALRHAFII